MADPVVPVPGGLPLIAGLLCSWVLLVAYQNPSSVSHR